MRIRRTAISEPVRRPATAFEAHINVLPAMRTVIWTPEAAHEPQRQPPLCACGPKDLPTIFDGLRRRILQPPPGARQAQSTQMQTSDPRRHRTPKSTPATCCHGQPVRITDALLPSLASGLLKHLNVNEKLFSLSSLMRHFEQTIPFV